MGGKYEQPDESSGPTGNDFRRNSRGTIGWSGRTGGDAGPYGTTFVRIVGQDASARRGAWNHMKARRGRRALRRVWEENADGPSEYRCGSFFPGVKGIRIATGPLGPRNDGLEGGPAGRFINHGTVPYGVVAKSASSVSACGENSIRSLAPPFPTKAEDRLCGAPIKTIPPRGMVLTL